MKIEHLAIWTEQLEPLIAFYTRYFAGEAGPIYYNPSKQFRSCFITFDSGSRLELMTQPGIQPRLRSESAQDLGLIHLAFSVGSEAEVDRLTAELAQQGYAHLDGPRRTGDGYYESTVLDPDGNRLEITV